MKEKRQYEYITYLYYFAAFLISGAGILLILKSQGFYPFKKQTLLILDLKEQCYAFYASLRYVLFGDNSPFFSWSRALGGNYIGVFAYYLASPLTFITLLFPVEKLYAAISLLTVLKIALCGLTFSIFSAYLWRKSHANKEDRKTKWQQFILLPLAVAYALMSYNIVYSQFLMWIDGVILLPLILLGVEKILEEKRGMLYLFFLFTMFISNYYIAYMVGIFTAIYLCYRLACIKKDMSSRKIFIILRRFLVMTLFAFGLTTPLVLPLAKDLKSGKLVGWSAINNSITNYHFWEIVSKLKNGAYDSIINGSLPYIYCGYLSLFLVLLYFLSKKIVAKEKVFSALVLLLLLFSFYLVKLDIAWHAFLIPNCFPHRYSFLFSFFVLYLGTRFLCSVSLEKVATIWDGKPIFECVLCVLLLITAIDLGINGRTILYRLGWQWGYTPVEEYEEYLNKTQPLIAQIQEENADFYRINPAYEFSKNDAMLLGFNGMTHYSSAYNYSVNQFTGFLGLAQASVWNSGYGSTPLTDSLLSVKYVLDERAVPEFYEKIGETAYGTASYRNGAALSIAFSTPITSLEPDLTSGNPFENQNALLNNIAGTTQVYFTNYEFETQNSNSYWNYSFTTESDNPVYLFMKSPYLGGSEVYVNGEMVGDYFIAESNCILYLGTYPTGSAITVEVRQEDEINIQETYIAQLHLDLLEETLSKLQRGNMQIENHQGAYLNGTITVQEGEMIVTSIPYDEGWMVKIDGETVKTQEFAETFLAIRADAGKHEISFSYMAPGFYTGLVVCVVTLLLCVLYFTYPIISSNKKE